MCMWFGFNPAVNFCHFSSVHFVIFRRCDSTSPKLDLYLDYFLSLFSTLWTYVIFRPQVYRQGVPCERNSSYNFIPIFLKLCTCFLHGLKMCMWFGYNPGFNFCLFFHFVNFVIVWPQRSGAVARSEASRLACKRPRVQSPRSAHSFVESWSWKHFYGHSPSSADSKRAVVSYWWKNVHLVLLNCLGGLPRNSVARLNDRAWNDLNCVEGP